jgi:hypothetical protein
VTALVDLLGSSLVARVHGAVDEVVATGMSIFEPDLDPRPGDVVLGVGLDDRDRFAAAVASVAACGAAALVTRFHVQPADLLDVVAERGVVWIELTPRASWMQVASAARSAFEFPLDVMSPAAPSTGFVDLSAQLSAVADLIAAPVILEDRSFRVIAYSDGHENADQQRREAIVHRRVPDRIRELMPGWLTEELARGERVVYVEPLEPGMLPRAAVGVVAGHEPLGAMWAVVAAPLDSARAEMFLAGAQAVAVSMVRMRSASSATNARTAVLAAVLRGGADRWSVVPTIDLRGAALSVLGVQVHGQRGVLAERARHRAAAGLAMQLGALTTHCEIVNSGDTEYLVVASDTDLERHTRRLRDQVAQFVAAAPRGSVVVVALGRAVTSASALADSRAEVDHVLRSLHARPALATQVAGIDDVYLDAVLAQLAELTRAGVLPVPPTVRRLNAHDEAHGSRLGAVLDVYLDCFGNVREASAASHVHTTTFRHRLRRVVDVSGIDLADSRQRLEAALGLEVLRRLGP